MTPIVQTTHCPAMTELKAVAAQESCWRFFGNLYYDTTNSINKQLEVLDDTTRELTLRFQQKFSEYFLDHCNWNVCPSSNWYVYAKDSLHPLQYYLLGLNAHINGDMWQALTDCFSEDELEQYQQALLQFQSAITTVYDQYYSLSLTGNIFLRTIHFFSMGLSRKIGNRYIYKCRDLQVKLALLYFRDKNKFEQKLRKAKRRKRLTDHYILLLFK